MKTFFILTATAAVAGCATPASRIQPAFVSPAIYRSSTCAQIATEAQNVSQMAATRTGQQNAEAGKDTVAMTVSLVLFWPALFFMDGKDMSGELAQLKGQMIALQQASDEKHCGLQFQAAPAPVAAAR